MGLVFFHTPQIKGKSQDAASGWSSFFRTVLSSYICLEIWQKASTITGSKCCPEPSVIIADEPFSALDASSQASIIKLLSDINTNNGTTLLIVSHNLRVIKAMCSKVIVMDKGKIVEAGDTDTVLNDPKSDTTAALLKARMYEA